MTQDMGNEIMTRNMESMENSGRIQGEFALNSKGIRAEFSEDPRLTRGQPPCAFLFPCWEHNIPTLGTKHSHAGNKTGLRLCLDDITARRPRHFSDLKGTECGVANVSCPTTFLRPLDGVWRCNRLVVTLLLMMGAVENVGLPGAVRSRSAKARAGSAPRPHRAASVCTR